MDKRADTHSSKSVGIGRREFFTLGASLAALGALGQPLAAQAAATDGWNAGQVTHLIPIANHERFLIKASFKSPLRNAPQLSVDGRRTPGIPTDWQGRFWRFDVGGLRPGASYELRLLDAGGAPLCDAWPLKTFPAPDASPERMRILAYTCAGGFDCERFRGKSVFLDMTARRRLLMRGLSFQPDAVIANGDHIYWDLQTWDNKPATQALLTQARALFGGDIDISLPMMHPRNAAIFGAVCDYQIPGLYGTALRSTPAWFLSDDHDMFENDEYDHKLATLPVPDYGRVAAELTQRMYYPEFLPDANRPIWLPGGDRAGMPEGTNGTFGTLRFGKLFETVLYDCRRHLDNKGVHARVVPPWVEDWLLARTRAEDTTHFFHTPSLPFAYSSGKLGDWYPDLLDARQGKLVTDRAKEGWQSGWHRQHQRLVEALSAQKKRAAVIVQGDFHASAAGRMMRSGDLDLSHNPVHAIMSGPLGTGDMGFPSAFRSIQSTPAASVAVEAAFEPTEKNGFTVIDLTPEKMTFSLYVWREPQDSVESIDTMKPAIVYEVPRRG